MYKGSSIALIIPARNEEQALPAVLTEVPSEVDYVIVADNGSTDATALVAAKHGTLVVSEPAAGYGRACQAGLRTLGEIDPDIVAFADADGSDDVSKLVHLIDPIVRGVADLVLEHRIPSSPNDMSSMQRYGNYLSTSLIHMLWGYSYHDLGPMRAIRWPSLRSLDMQDRDYGWTVEMQVKALKKGLRVWEIPLPYRARAAGKSKVSRNLMGSIRAGRKILWVILREAIFDGSAKATSRMTSDQ